MGHQVLKRFRGEVFAVRFSERRYEDDRRLVQDLKPVATPLLAASNVGVNLEQPIDIRQVLIHCFASLGCPLSCSANDQAFSGERPPDRSEEGRSSAATLC